MEKAFYVVILTALVSCSRFAIEEKIIDNYYLIATDTGEDCKLDYREPADEDSYGTIIGATVFAVGHNDEYIIAKQHPRTFPKPPDKTITNYFILRVKKSMDWRSKDGQFGPLTLEQFNGKRNELGIPKDLGFTKVFKDLE